MSVKSAVARMIEATPVLSDLFLYRSFGRRYNTCRGFYQTVQEANDASPKSVESGYNQSVIGDSDSVSQITANKDSETLDPKDYPVLFWLSAIFPDVRRLFNLGGNVGLEFYAYRKKLAFPDTLEWTVCEIPEIVDKGAELARERGEERLDFTTGGIANGSK